MAKKSDEKDAIRKIWLAGIGAYGRAFTEAKGAVESLTGKSSEVFEELLEREANWSEKAKPRFQILKLMIVLPKCEHAYLAQLTKVKVVLKHGFIN